MGIWRNTEGIDGNLGEGYWEDMFGRSSKTTGLWAVLFCVATGCVGDLKIVHTPDLWKVTAKEERKAAPGPKPAGVPNNAYGIERIYSSLAPFQSLCDLEVNTAAVAPYPSAKDQFILVDLGCLRTVSQIRMIHPAEHGYPIKYRVDVAGTHNYPYSLVLVDCGTPTETVGVFRKPVECRFLRITLLETSDDPWCVRELSIH